MFSRNTNTMRTFLMLTLTVVLFSCQKEELTIVEAETETSFLSDAQLTGLVKSVASHDGSYDDVIDQSSCFSINFPYQIYLNGELLAINGINDLLGIKSEDSVEMVYPFTITFANYLEATIPAEKEFTNFISRCEEGLMYNDRITCVDFSYPVRISVYNTATSNFETLIFNHDKETFTEIELMDAGTLANIQFPIQLQFADGTYRTIESNEQLKIQILELLPICE